VSADTVVVFNPTDTLRPADVVRVTVPNTIIKSVEFADENGAPLASQLLSVSPKGERDFLVLVPEVGALGYRTLTVGRAPGPQEETTVTAEPGILENEFVRVELDEFGEVVSLVQKVRDEDEGEEVITEREVIAAGQVGNRLVAYEDRPYAYSAWNIDPYYEDKPYPLADIGEAEPVRVIENGPVRAGVEVRRRFLHSTLVQRIYLYAHSPRVEFVTEVDWHEHQTLLKVAFPVAVNARAATYEIQHGAIERPTHRNTPWDAAQFEVCAHKWADLSEGDYGVSLLNDCKYGHDIHGNVLRLTLIKSGTHPDPDADQGRHVFTYALLPHTGDWRNETVDEAFALNYPLLSRFVVKPQGKGGGGRDLPPAYELATVDDQGIVIDAIKKAEDGDGIIVRLYEAFNTRGSATLTLGFDVAEAFEVNMLEEDPRPLEVVGAAEIPFTYRPFEVKTFLICPEK
jgi:alpha-mannosidase